MIGLIPAAGSGQRFGAAVPKQFSLLHGEPVLIHAVRALLQDERLDEVVVIVSPGDNHTALLLESMPGVRVLHCGGDTRQQTVHNGLHALLGQGLATTDWILVHDAARPGLTRRALSELIDTALTNPVGAIVALPVADTLKRASTGQALVDVTVPREHLWAAQTPQMFRIGPLSEALRAAGSDGLAFTDEASAMEHMGAKAALVRGDMQNWKITFAEDLTLVEQLMKPHTQLSIQSHSQPAATPALRMGQGYDVHVLVAGRPLILGGVTIPHNKGLLGHSDADALLHAITDACLGAAGLGDIGQHFPDTDTRFKGADSGLLLQTAMERVRAAGWVPVNVDTTLIAQRPKLAEHIPAIRARVAQLMGLDPSAVNVKAKTNEKLGYLGREEAIEAQAVVLLAAPA